MQNALLWGQDGNSRRDSPRQWHLSEHLRGKYQGYRPSLAIGKANNQTTGQSSSPTEPGLFSTWVYSTAEPGPLMRLPWSIGPFWQGFARCDLFGESCWFPVAIEMWSVLKEVSSSLTLPPAQVAGSVMCGPMGTWSCSNWKKGCLVPSSFPVKRFFK